MSSIKLVMEFRPGHSHEATDLKGQFNLLTLVSFQTCMTQIFLWNINILTSIFFVNGNQNCLVSNIFQNILCSTEEKVIGLERHEGK